MPLRRLRQICLALPEAEERTTWDAPTFRVRGKIFAMAPGRAGADVWIKAPRGSQALLVEAAPQRFFVPPYLGPKGWVGIRLEEKPDWAEVAALVRRSYRLVAPKRLAALVEEDAP
jgi:predicted DNA-binding protein (MmcQ/YjbR family)